MMKMIKNFLSSACFSKDQVPQPKAMSLWLSMVVLLTSLCSWTETGYSATTPGIPSAASLNIPSRAANQISNQPYDMSDPEGGRSQTRHNVAPPSGSQSSNQGGNTNLGQTGQAIVTDNVHVQLKGAQKAQDLAAGGVYITLKNACEAFGKKVYGDLAPSTMKLLSAFFFLLLVWKVCIEGLLQKSFDLMGIGKLLISFCIVSVFINIPDSFQHYFYEPIRDTALEIATKASAGWVKIPGQAPGIEGLLGQVDNVMSSVQNMAWKVEGAVKWYDFSTILYTTIVTGIYYVITWMFLFYVADLYFGLMIVTALGPLFLAGYLFKVTRGYSEAALRLAVCSCLTLILASLCIGLIFNSYVVTLNGLVDGVGKDLKSFAAISLRLSSIGFICLLFMRKSAHIAASLTGTNDSGTSGLMMGAMMTTAYMVKNVTTMGISRAAGALSAAGNAAGGEHKRTPLYTLSNGKNIYSDQEINQ